MRNLQINQPSKGNSHDKAGSSLQSKAMSHLPNSPPKANSVFWNHERQTEFFFLAYIFVCFVCMNMWKGLDFA